MYTVTLTRKKRKKHFKFHSYARAPSPTNTNLATNRYCYPRASSVLRLYAEEELKYSPLRSCKVQRVPFFFFFFCSHGSAALKFPTSGWKQRKRVEETQLGTGDGFHDQSGQLIDGERDGAGVTRCRGDTIGKHSTSVRVRVSHKDANAMVLRCRNGLSLVVCL